jgi:hypothetical protein
MKELKYLKEDIKVISAVSSSLLTLDLCIDILVAFSSSFHNSNYT